MSAFTLQLSGLTELQDRLKNLSSNLQTQVVREIKASTATISNEAAQMAPVDLGRLKGEYYWDSIGLEGAEVGNLLEYAPFVEFGTGTEVDVPAGLEEYAMQFKGEGKRQVNLPARPSLFPAFEAEKPNLLKRILEIIK